MGKGLEVRSIGDLIQPGSYRLHSRFTHAVNFVNGNALIAVVDASVGAGPVNIVTDDLADWEFGDLEIGTDDIHANGRGIPLHDVPRYDSSLRIPENTDSTLFNRNLAVLRGHLIGMASEESLAVLHDQHPVGPVRRSFENALRQRFTEAIALLRKGRLRDGVRLIKGLGRGLTPQGDDFIAGLLFALHLRRLALGHDTQRQLKTVAAAARSDNPFSRALLDCAAQGRAFERLRDLIASLFGTDRGQIELKARGLLDIGATSGADLATGLVLGMETRKGNS